MMSPCGMSTHQSLDLNPTITILRKFHQKVNFREVGVQIWQSNLNSLLQFLGDKVVFDGPMSMTRHLYNSGIIRYA
jgi:hypothetical protein